MTYLLKKHYYGLFDIISYFNICCNGLVFDILS